MKNWFLALRPWSFTMSAVSVTVGVLWAWESGISWWLYALMLATIFFFHGATNLMNDYFDIKNRIDSPDAPTVQYRPHPLAHEEISLEKAFWVASVLYVVAAAGGFYLTYLRGLPVLIIGLMGAVISLGYTKKPLAFKYRALGELSVFLVWGPLAVQGAYYVETLSFSLPLLLVSVPVGMLVSLVLLANNIRDESYDRKQNILTIPVVLGGKNSRVLFVAMIVFCFVLLLVMSIVGPLSLWSLLVLLAVPPAVSVARMIYVKTPDDADARAAKLDTVFGILLIVSLLLERFL